MKISELSFLEQSKLFASISSIAYKDESQAKKMYKELGYGSIYFDNKGSQAYVVYDSKNFILACRGTEPNRIEDIITDIKIRLVPSVTGVRKSA